MKINLHPLLESGLRVIVFFLILFLSVEGDRFAFGMMDAKNAIRTGLGISLFLANNILFLFLIFKFSISTFHSIKK